MATEAGGDALLLEDLQIDSEAFIVILRSRFRVALFPHVDD
jgi:hypothetical protein